MHSFDIDTFIRLCFESFNKYLLEKKFDLIDCQKVIAYKSTNLIKIMQGFGEINELYVCKKKIHSIAGKVNQN